MSRSFLKPEEIEEGKRRLRPPGFPIDGRLTRAPEFEAGDFSRWLLQGLMEKWRRDPDFLESLPILVGSASRDELCPRSDLDVLFAGSEEAGARFVRSCLEKGLRLRSRFPESLDDWTLGVDVPDILALREGRALTPRGEALLREQQRQIELRARKERRSWLKTLRKERRAREERFDSIANVLEPNLKYGPGGLRDLDQGRQVLRLFPERFQNGEAERAALVFSYYAKLWTLIRQRLHLEGQTDLLTGSAQFDLARWFGMEHKHLMREIQRGLSRVHFYSEWIFARAGASTALLAKVEKVSLETPEKVVKALEDDPGILMQHRVRQSLSAVFPKSWIATFPKERGALLEKVLRPGASDEFVRAVFQSRLIDRLQPEFKPLVGHVQHDQYHRYTADVHLQQACREFQKALKTPSRLGPLAKEVRETTPVDRKILGFSMLFHDLMKGRDGDHSKEGRLLVRKEFQRFGWSESLTEEVGWLVENHLILSRAAFRRNPLAPATWTDLREKGATGNRLRRLAIFTALDILATNPEAWTTWKARLLVDLLKAIRSPSAQAYFVFEKELRKKKLKLSASDLDGYLISRLPPSKLAADLALVSRSKGNLPPELLKLRNGDLWIRVHRREDQIGFFAEAVQGLYSLGLSVRHASVRTLPELGIYDWFQVSARRTPAQLRAMLKNGLVGSRDLPDVKFDSITLVSQDDTEWIFSFKGMDKPGCLAVAAKALVMEGLSLSSARVHTWGRQIDDVFGVKPSGNADEILRCLRDRVGDPNE